MKTKSVAWFSIFLFFSSCAIQRIETSVNTTVDPQVNAKKQPHNKYVLMPPREGVDPETDLQYREFEQTLNQKLQSRGFITSSTLEGAGVVIFVDYGVGDPQIQDNTMSMPVPANPVSTPGDGARNYGTVPLSYSQTAHTMFLYLEAVDAIQYRVNQKIVPVWKTIVISKSPIADLRLVLPYMADAAKPYFGRNTSNAVRTVTTLQR